MTSQDHLVIALDDDRSILTSLERLLPAHGHPLRSHDNPADFFRAGLPDVPCCLLLDQQLDFGATGTEVHAEMHRRGWKIPTIFLTAHGNIPLVVETMRAGADGFLTKPYQAQQLLREIDRALAHSRALAEEQLTHRDLSARAATLTRREREVVALVVKGHLNKEIAALLGISMVTVKVHRGRAMHKFDAGNPAELAQLAISAGLVEAS